MQPHRGPKSAGKAILSAIPQQLNLSDYRKKHWEGSFDEYLDFVREHPEVTRSAYQRLYDMILSHGTEEVYKHKEKVTRYKFFTEFATRHGDAIYGLDRQLMHARTIPHTSSELLAYVVPGLSFRGSPQPKRGPAENPP
jgi:predicted Ser/Thr protein kinase